MVFCCLFFFSSRRRHTRSLCDWSSDVCSSDLFPQGLPPEPARAVRIRGPHTRPLPAPRGAEIDLRAAVLGHRLAAGPEAVARPLRPSALAVADTRDPSAGHWAASIPTTRTPFARSPSPPGRYSHAPPHAATPTPAPRTGDHSSATKRVESWARLHSEDLCSCARLLSSELLT